MGEFLKTFKLEKMGCEILESRRKAKEERERERESESGAHKNPFKRYR